MNECVCLTVWGRTRAVDGGVCVCVEGGGELAGPTAVFLSPLGLQQSQKITRSYRKMLGNEQGGLKEMIGTIPPLP